jgi:hypothetical protein
MNNRHKYFRNLRYKQSLETRYNHRDTGRHGGWTGVYFVTDEVDPRDIREQFYQYQTRFWKTEVTPEEYTKMRLDDLTKKLSEDELVKLNTNNEYLRLSTEIQQNVQNEIMNLIKNKLNSRNDIIDNIKRQISIIRDVQDETSNEQRKNIAELNDYMKNYAHLTFQQYKDIKNNVNVDLNTNSNTSTKKSNNKKDNIQ